MIDLLFGPFIEFGFMRRALVGCLALSLSAPPVGVFLMLRRMSLMSDAMSHAILPGAAIGFLVARRFDRMLAVAVVVAVASSIVGTLAGVPRAIAGVLARAYPQRSVECLLDHVDRTGRTWPCVLVGVALLGATHPAVKELESLDDVCRLYGLDVAASGRRVVTASAHPSDTAAARARAIALARARRTRSARSITV